MVLGRKAARNERMICGDMVRNKRVVLQNLFVKEETWIMRENQHSVLE